MALGQLHTSASEAWSRYRYKATGALADQNIRKCVKRVNHCRVKFKCGNRVIFHSQLRGFMCIPVCFSRKLSDLSYIIKKQTNMDLSSKLNSSVLWNCVNVFADDPTYIRDSAISRNRTGYKVTQAMSDQMTYCTSNVVPHNVRRIYMEICVTLNVSTSKHFQLIRKLRDYFYGLWLCKVLGVKKLLRSKIIWKENNK